MTDIKSTNKSFYYKLVCIFYNKLVFFITKESFATNWSSLQQIRLVLQLKDRLSIWKSLKIIRQWPDPKSQAGVLKVGI